MKFSLPLPPSINRTYKTGRGTFYKAKEAKDWEYEVDRILTYEVEHKQIKDPCIIHLNYYFKTLGRDVDGSIKITLDALQRNGIFKNDNIVKRVIATKYKDKLNPRVEIGVTLW